MSIQKLAIDGGTPVISASEQPVPQLRWGDEEIVQVTQALKQESLFYWRGPQTARLIDAFKAHYPLQYVMPCSSGSAAIHIALLAMNLKPGDEVITSPVTDQGTVIGILYQQGVPVSPTSIRIRTTSIRKASSSESPRARARFLRFTWREIPATSTRFTPSRANTTCR